MIAAAQRLADAAWFQNLVVTVIIANAIVLGIETYDGAVDRWGDALHAVDMLFRHGLKAREVEQGGEQVGADDRRIAGASGGDLAGPADDRRLADAPFVNASLAAAASFGRIEERAVGAAEPIGADVVSRLAIDPEASAPAAARYFNHERRALLAKDIRLFWRDTTQWGQTLVLFGLLAVYVINLRHFSAQLTDTRGDARERAMEDVMWALVNATEFSWNH